MPAVLKNWVILRPHENLLSMIQKSLMEFHQAFFVILVRYQGKRGNCPKFGLRFSLKASRPSFASSVV